MDNLLAELDEEVSIVLALEVSQEELVQRLLNRGKASGRSDDTNEDVIRARIVEYVNKTSPVAGHYQQFGKVKRVKEKEVSVIFSAHSPERSKQSNLHKLFHSQSFASCG